MRTDGELTSIARAVSYSGAARRDLGTTRILGMRRPPPSSHGRAVEHAQSPVTST
jgi:hypothetical protein